MRELDDITLTYALENLEHANADCWALIRGSVDAQQRTKLALAIHDHVNRAIGALQRMKPEEPAPSGPRAGVGDAGPNEV